LEEEGHKGHGTKSATAEQEVPPEHHQLLPFQHNAKPDDPSKNVNC